MPSQKTRSKEDTWTPDELNKALSKTSDRRHHRDRDEDRKKDRIYGEEKHRRHREEDSDRRRKHRDEDENGSDVRLTEEERERQREERRRRREGKDSSSSKDKKGKEIQFRGKSDHKEIELNDVDETEDRRRRHHGDRDRKHRDDAEREKRHHDREERHRDDDERERRRHHRDDDNDRDKRRKHRDDDDDDALERRRKHRDDDDREKRRKHRDEDDEDERERRRMERRLEREAKEDEERRRRHEEKKDRRKERDRDREKDKEERSDKHRDRDRHEREERSDRHRDRKDRDRHRETEEEKEERREREREERRREKEERHREKEEKRKQPKEEKKEEEDDEYNYEEDFEDYEEDFEDEDEEEERNQPRHIQLTPSHARTHTWVVQESIHKKAEAGSRLDYSDSEVNDVLRALDAENERLLNSSSRSPQVSAKQYGRDYDRGDSNREEDSDDGYQKSYQPRMDRPRTAINFVSAKQRAVSRKTASKTMQRGKDLLKMLELDFASFDIMDMPPVNEYDLYIRAFGSSNTRQAYVQTNEDNIDKDIQTEEIDARQKWTQHPPEDFRGCGRGDGDKDFEEEEESHSKYNREQDMGRLNKFLERAGQMIAILLEEGKEEQAGTKGQTQTHINVSEGYTQFDILPILQGRYVIYSYFSPIQPSLLLTVYSPAPQVSEENPVSKRGVICVWNTIEPNYPQKILVCSSQPKCCCFSPAKPSLVFAGMVDGSIAMWDLREPTSIHRPIVVNEETYSLRYPTYDTASVLKEENHHSPVSSIQPIYSYIDMSKTDGQQSQASEDTSSGLSFQLVSTEESAVLHFWVVAEIGRPEMAGSESDLGLAPGAGVKLLKSSSLTMTNPSKDSRLQAGLRVLDMSLMPNDPNHFYVATDSGSILHGIRFGKRTFPRAHSPVIETIIDVVSIDFSPFDQPCFLAGCSDGSFSIYHTKSENPLITWPSVTKGQAVQCVKWSQSRPCVFYVLDVTSTLYVFDLLEGDVQPKHIETISKERITSFSLTTVQRPDGLGSSGKDAQMLFCYDSGRTEIHTVTKSLREPDQLETDYLASYLQRF